MPKGRLMLIASGIIGLLLVFGLLTRALSTGSWWQYGAAFVTLVLSVKLFVKATDNE